MDAYNNDSIVLLTRAGLRWICDYLNCRPLNVLLKRWWEKKLNYCG